MKTSSALPLYGSPPEQRRCWYLAYGSNLSVHTFREVRHIEPIAAISVRVPGWTLTMSSAGFPYREPAFASIRPLLPDEQILDDKGYLCSEPLIGTAYLITLDQWIEIIASEGGAIAYDEIVTLAEPLHAADMEKWGSTIHTFSLKSSMERWPAARPSSRYMSLILHGAAAANFPASYIHHIEDHFPYYVPRSTRWARTGAMLFLAFWTPILTMLSYLTHHTTQKDGHVPPMVRSLVRGAMLLMWLVHDILWAPIWGRGDGIEQEEMSSHIST